MRNLTPITTNNQQYSFIIPLDVIRCEIISILKIILTEKKYDETHVNIALFEVRDEINTFIKDLVISIVLSLGRLDRYGNRHEPAYAQPFIHSEHRSSILFLLGALINKIVSLYEDNVDDNKVTDLANNVFNRCENLVIETLNLYMNGSFPHAGNLVSVQAVSSQPKSDICITVTVEIVESQ